MHTLSSSPETATVLSEGVLPQAEAKKVVCTEQRAPGITCRFAGERTEKRMELAQESATQTGQSRGRKASEAEEAKADASMGIWLGDMARKCF